MLCVRHRLSVGPSQAGIASKRPDKSSCLLGHSGFLLYYHTLFCKEIWVPPKIRVLPSGTLSQTMVKQGKGSPYSTAERSVPELIPVLGSQPAGNESHKPGGRLPLLSARPLRGLLPISLLLLGEQRHDGCEQFVYLFEPRPFCA